MRYKLKHDGIERTTKYVHETANIILERLRFSNVSPVVLEFGGHSFVIDTTELEAILRKSI